MSLGLKIIISIFLILGINYLSNTKYAYLSMLLPLFPTFALIANFFVYSNNPNNPEVLQKTLLFGMFSLFPYFVYLGIMYFAVPKFNFFISAILGILGWSLAAGVLVYVFPS